MSKVIETPRLILRELTFSDAPGMFRLDSDPEVHRFLGNNPVTTMQQVEDVIGMIHEQYAQNGIGRWAVTLKETGAFLGWSGLKLESDKNGYDRFYDLGYRLIPEYWGKGYATESAEAFVAFGFRELQLEKICGYTAQGNLSSAKVLQKAGLCFTNTFACDGETCNWYELDRNVWATG
ncbi:GNAT family N-acetyltransferase [Flavobacterium magnum]|uniref:GNAT family N-acetyltransferase n=1 Tax=Flavobacterium magnum TaxID=2162713 RepID=A0A2S0RHN6_9FLAO|nr:GNAT family N-acetyltransferase [Flavobacterium magnum]AWA31447.1 GNAT family N-acetyltransferase [Flavobacterium magnum]